MVAPQCGRSWLLGIGILKEKPGPSIFFYHLITGVRAIRKMMGDIVSTWETPLVIGKTKVTQEDEWTKPVRLP